MIRLKIGDVITVNFNPDQKFKPTDSRICKLYDIAIWKVARTVKGITIRNLEVPFEIRTDKEQAHEEAKLRRKSKYTFNDGDRFEVGLPNYETAIYEINIRPKWRHKHLIGGISFRKMTTT